ncbi:MAG: sialate O-acetylesterase [Ginsengibacter sp.]
MRKFLKTPILLSALFAFLNVRAEIRLPAIIGSHMVLQQNSTVKIWGWCDPSEKIKITSNWDTTSYNTIGIPDGKWMLSIKTPAAGGPYTLTLHGSNQIVLEDILIGEVWDCSGQSNMELHYNPAIKLYDADAENATNKSIRLFHVPRLSADYPQDDTKGNWVVCNPEDMKQFSLAGYFFGLKLQETLAFPVGLIEASWGGTPAEVWTPKEAIDNNAVIKEAAGKLTPVPWGPIRVAATYNAMIHPLTNFTIAGVLWYQGEANVSAASTYQLLFSTMITSWRKAWGIDFPFYFVQIAPYAGYGNNISAALLREAQNKTTAVSKTGVVVATDLVSDINDIHPTNKKDVGLRLADYALAETYGKKGFAYKSPEYKNLKIEKQKIRLFFDYADNGLMSKGDTIKEFYIAGADKIFMPAIAKIDKSSILVWNKNIKNPVAVRFGFTNYSIPNLFNKEGLPVNIFRTDDWDDINTVSAK